MKQLYGTRFEKSQRNSFKVLKKRGDKLHKSHIVYPDNDTLSVLGYFNPPAESTFREFSPRQTEFNGTRLHANDSFLSQPSIISQLSPKKCDGIRSESV